MSDLGKLSDAELGAAATLLSEQAHQITLAQEKVRDELARRRSTLDAEKHATFDERGESALSSALAGAPDRAAELAELEADRQAQIAAVLEEVPEPYREQHAAALGEVPWPVPQSLLDSIVEQYRPPQPDAE